MKVSSYIQIKRIYSDCFAPIFRGTNNTVFLDVDRDIRLANDIPCFYKTRKEAIEAIQKWLPKFINQ